MSPLFETIAFWLADVHLLAGALLALVFPALLLIRQPAQRMAVCKSALAALVGLVVLCALPGWSLVHLASAEAPPSSLVVAAHSPSTAPFTPPVIERDPTPDAFLAPEVSQNLPSPAPLRPAAALPTFSWPLALVLLQATGSVAVVSWLAAGAVMVRRLCRTSQRAPLELQGVLANLSGAAASPPALLVNASISTPVALGVRRPAILLPAALLQPPALPGGSATIITTSGSSGANDQRGATPGQSPGLRASGPLPLRAILAHELAHIAAGDLRTLAVTRLLLVLFWPQPLFWLLRRWIRFDQESLADAAGAEVAGRLSYAEQLVGWAHATGPRGRGPRLAGAVGLWEGHSQLKRRITLLLDEQVAILRMATRGWRLGTLVAAVMVAALLSLVTTQQREVVQAAATESAEGPDADAEGAVGAIDFDKIEIVRARTPSAVFEAIGPMGAEVGSLGLRHIQTGSDGEGVLQVESAAGTDWARAEPNVIKGRAVAPSSEPLAGVEVTLYRVVNGPGGSGSPQAASVQTTGADGSFRFENVVDVAKEFPNGLPDERFIEQPVLVLTVVGRMPGRASTTGSDVAVFAAKRGGVQQLILDRAATLTGRVTDGNGRPVADAAVRVGSPMGGTSGDLIHSASTDAEGRYEITDLAPFDAAAWQRKHDEFERQHRGDGFIAIRVDDSLRVQVRHPNFATRGAKVLTIPGAVDLELAPAAAIEGVVVVRDRAGVALPSASAVVNLMRELQAEERAKADVDVSSYQALNVRTDAAGRYRFDGLPAGRYAINAQVEGFVSNGLTGVKTTEGQTSAAPELVMTRGGTARIKLVDIDTERPLPLADGTRAYIHPYPSPQLSQSESIEFKSSIGELQLPAGRYRFYVSVPGASEGDPFWNSVGVNGPPVREHDVVEDETVEVTVRMTKGLPQSVPNATLQFTPLLEAAPSRNDANPHMIPKVDFVPDLSLDLVPPGRPADNQGRSAGGILDKIDPALDNAAQAQVIVAPLDQWGYGVDDTNEAPLR